MQDSHSCDWGSNPHSSILTFGLNPTSFFPPRPKACVWKCAPTLSDSSFPLHQEHNSINHGLANGRLTACDADLIREFIAESQSCNNISAGRTNKIVFTLVGWRRFIGPYLENKRPRHQRPRQTLQAEHHRRPHHHPQTVLWGAIENGYTDLPDRKIRRLKIPTKDTMTKEAAALETVAAMGWEQFTIKMLQEAIGLSYQQTYRILNGYASRGATHSGLLEKCPAVSYFDTMVTEDGEGYAVRRREHLFSFDRAVYRRWAFGGGDRDDGPGPSDSFSISAGLPRDFSTGREREGGGNGSGSHSTSTDRETRFSLSTLLQQSTHPDAGAGAGTGAGVCGCDRQNGESDPAMSAECGERRKRGGVVRPFECRRMPKGAERRRGC